ncbi:MAG: hypothetical protein JSS99_17065 [Actinobacteria bacterium]|nr:hypothetical protein [Actinomycetota bacterium]
MSVTGDGAGAGDETGGGVDEAGWSPTERALLDAALGFYAAAEGVLDFAGRERPQLRHDAAAFHAVRDAMRLLEERVLAAHAAGATRARLAEIARIEPETIALILERRGVAPSRGDG